MTKGYSLYLDVLRFSAALVVFFSHVASQDLSDGFLWQFKAYSQTAVMIFFVMSGYVIGFVTHEKEKLISDYAVARISRLYSVVIPALVLTAVCDFIGLQFNPELYTQSPWPYPEGSQLQHYILSFFLVQNIWDLDLNPGINGPFWSLTYEWIYYILFGVYFFFKSKIKWIAILLISICAGPSIISLFPIWLFGLGLYQIQQNSKKQLIYSHAKALLAVLSVLAIIFIGPQVREIETSTQLISRGNILGDYFDGVMFTVHLYFCPHIIEKIKPLLIRYERAIRWSASLTFAFYLFHRPIIQLVAAIYDGERSDNLYRAVMIIFTFIIVATLGRWCEQKKFDIKNALTKVKAKINS